MHWWAWAAVVIVVIEIVIIVISLIAYWVDKGTGPGA
jgi:hypothetical protein